MWKGIVQTGLFYAAGFLISQVVYMLYGHPYIHAPGLHHFIGFFTLFVGFNWGLIALYQYFKKGKLPIHLTIFTITSVAFLSFLGYIIFYPYFH